MAGFTPHLRFDSDRGHARRVIVTLVIATAAAAVTAGVALQKRPHAEAVGPVAGAAPALAGGIAAPAAPVLTRREQWRDPWKRSVPLSESAPKSIHESADAVTASDASLPTAAEALQRAAGASDESAPTF